jgi:hypothetical protein
VGARREVGRWALARSAAFFVVGFIAGMVLALLSPVRAGRATR